MITTITLDPSFDIRYYLNGFKVNHTYKVISTKKAPGGKGINVSKVLKSLNTSFITTGLLGGTSGKWIKSELDSAGIENEFCFVSGETRTYVSIIVREDSQTDIYEKGPWINKKELSGFLEKYENYLEFSDIICASGDVPKGVPKDIYNTMIEMSNEKNSKFLLDTCAEITIKSIEAKPFLVKADKEKLEKMSKRTLETTDEIIAYGKTLVAKGAQNLLVPLGEKGAILINSDLVLRANIPQIHVVDTDGSGDAMIGGFAYALKNNYSLEDCFEFAVACGTANAMNAKTATVTSKDLKYLEKKIKIDVEEL